MMKKFRFTKFFVFAVTVFILLSFVGYSSVVANDSFTGYEYGDLLEKYDPEITLTAWRYLNQGIEFEKGDTIEDNIYMKAYKEQLGINLKYNWVVPQEQFEQKLNISIASGDLPDIMWLTNKQLIQLAENDLLYDLTDLFDKYTSSLTKDIMLQDKTSFNTAKIGGKLMAIPHTSSAIDSLHLMYIRTDWLKNLGLSEPKNMQDVLKIADGFTNDDPDQNGKDDTFGMALTKNFLTDSHASAMGFFAGYHAYPRRWIKDAAGQLIYGSIQPEMKPALQRLQDMYKNGLLDREFGVKNRAKVAESVAAGKVGIEFGSMSGPLSFLQPNVDNDPEAEWQPFPLPSIDNEPAAPIAKMPIRIYYAVNKNCQYPEAIMKLLEFGTKGYSKEADNEYGINKNGIGVFQYAIVGYEPARKNLDAHLHILDALQSNDPSKLNVEEKGYYDKILDYRNGNREMWGFERVFGTPSSFDVIGQYVDENNMIYDGFYGAPTPTMVYRNATLEKMEEEVFTKIIMGQSIDAFDKFVDNWKKLGGNQITEEVNEWAQKNK